MHRKIRRLRHNHAAVKSPSAPRPAHSPPASLKISPAPAAPHSSPRIKFLPASASPNAASTSRAVIFLHLKCPRLFRLRKCRRVHHHGVKLPAPSSPADATNRDTSPKMKSCSATASSPLSAKFRLPHSKYFFDKSRLVVRAPAFAAHTENPQVYANAFNTFHPRRAAAKDSRKSPRPHN